MFLCENAELFPHLQKHSQVNSFKTEPQERWTALDNLHELVTAPPKKDTFLFAIQLSYKRPHKTQERCLYFTAEAKLELLQNINYLKRNTFLSTGGLFWFIYVLFTLLNY